MIDRWQHFRTDLIEEPVLGFRLDTSRMLADEASLASLKTRMQQALIQMSELEGGAIANPDEGRRVGHYWLRAPELAPERPLGAQIHATRERIKAFARQVHEGVIAPLPERPFRHLLVIGIGGSALGPQLVADALGGPDDALRPHFVDNTDPDGMDRTLALLGADLAATLVLVISKSGGTQETRNGMLEVRRAFESAGRAFATHTVAVTGEGSALDRLAEQEGFLARFPMWDWVGGRTSVTSAVGLLPAALQGVDVNALLEGARRMDVLTRGQAPRHNPAARMALHWHAAGGGRGRRNLVILPYKDRLLLLSRYLQQLIMESIGKEKDLSGETVHQGLTVYGNKGSTDQHAFVQQLREGPDDFFVTFVEVLRDRAGESIEVEPRVTSGDYLLGFLLGTRAALHQAGRGSMTITIPTVDALSLGALIALFERTVGLYAGLLGINAYHQPGVEAGKRAAGAVLDLQNRVVDLFERGGMEALTVPEIALRLDAADQADVIFHLVEHLAANGRLHVVRQTQAGDHRYSLR